MRILVTGGAGFIGSHLVEEFLRRGGEVAVLDDLSTGRRENLGAIEGRIRFLRGSVLDRTALEGASEGCDWIVHLAAAVGVRRVLADPAGSIERNVLGTANAAAVAAARKAGLLFASSSEVYGVGHPGPLSEDGPLVLGPPARPRTAYGVSKALGECLVSASSRAGARTVVVRLFNVVGPRQRARYGMVLPSFVAAALAAAPLEVHGDGSQRRSFAFVGDVVRTLADLLEEPCARGGTFNVGEDREISILGLAALVLARTKSVSAIRLVPHARALGPGVDDFPRRTPNLLRIRALLGPRSATPLENVVDLVAADRRRLPVAAVREG